MQSRLVGIFSQLIDDKDIPNDTITETHAENIIEVQNGSSLYTFDVSPDDISRASLAPRIDTVLTPLDQARPTKPVRRPHMI